MPQFDYTHPTLLLGQVASGNPYTINSYLNALLAQESEISIGAGPAAGDYTVRIVGEEGTFEFTYTSPGAETEAQIVAGLLAALNSDPDLVNIVAGTDASPELELDFIHPGADYTISFPSNPGPGDMSQALIQAAGGTALNLAIVVVASDPAGISTGAQHVTAPDAGTVDADFLGMTVRASVDVLVNTGDPNQISQFAPGATLSVMEEGESVVEVEDAVAFNGAVFVRTQNPGPGQHLGGFRSDADGGDAIAMTGARYRSATTGNGLAKVTINRP